MSGERIVSRTPHIAIAGVSGRIGSQLENYWGTAYHIVGLRKDEADRPGAPTSQSLEYRPRNRTSDILYGFDVTNPEVVDKYIASLRAQGIRTFVNAAGLATITEEAQADRSPTSEMNQINVVGTGNIARACKKYGIKLLHLSTEYVFDGTKPYPQRYAEAESTAPGLDNPTTYGASKATAEQLVQDIFLDSPQDYVIVRCPQVQIPTKKGGFFTYVRQWLKEDFPKIGKPNETVQPLNLLHDQYAAPLTISTVIEALGKIEYAMHNQGLSGIINIAATTSGTIFDLGVMLLRQYLPSHVVDGLLEQGLVRSVTTAELFTPQLARPKNSNIDPSRYEALFSHLPSSEEEVAAFAHKYPLP